jgi:hypothetical protein
MKKLFLFMPFIALLFFCKSYKIDNNEFTRTENKIDVEEKTTFGRKVFGNRSGTNLQINIDPLDRMKNRPFWQLDIHNLYWITEYPNTVKINFGVVDIDKIDFSPLFKLEGLEHITIWCHDDSLVDFPDFSGIKKLKTINIYNSSIKSFENIGKNLPDIENLHINSKDFYGIEIKNLDCLSEIKTLRELFLHQGSKMELKFSDFYGLTNLEWFKTHSSGVIDFAGIEKLTSLKYLDLSDSTPKNIQNLGTITTLQELHLRIDNSVDNIDFLNTLINLETLCLYNSEYNGQHSGVPEGKKLYQKKIDLRLINNLSVLKRLYLGGFIVDNIIILNELTLLNEIDLCDCFVLPDNDTSIIKENIWLRRGFAPDH